MIDIHSHILPALDDGPLSLKESVAMLRIAEQAGTTDIAATPHANLDFAFSPQRTAEKIAELAAAAGSSVRIHSGCDFHLSFDNIQDALANPSKYTINGRRYLLVEFSDLLIARTIEDVFERMRAAGISPVITHPERNWLLQQRIERLAVWIESGCYLQVTAQSFFGRFGPEARDFARELMARDMVHFIASDAHDPEDRVPRLDEAFRYVSKKFGPERAARLLIENPRAALAGEPLEYRKPQPASNRKRLWFWVKS